MARGRFPEAIHGSDYTIGVVRARASEFVLAGAFVLAIGRLVGTYQR